MNMSIHMAPMQGLTDALFRRVYRDCFKGIERTYCPFLLLNRGALRGRDKKELAAGLEEGEGFVPQIVAARPEEAKQITALLVDHGFSRVNLNLGCPFPMLTKRGRGSGALPDPERVSAILTAIFEEEGILEVSVKTRLGLESPREFIDVVSVFNRFPLKEVIVHPRVGKQKFKGTPMWEVFGVEGATLHAPVVANGDIETPEDAQSLKERFPFIKGIMLGRGLLRDPFLPARIKKIDGSTQIKEEKERGLAEGIGGTKSPYSPFSKGKPENAPFEKGGWGDFQDNFSTSFPSEKATLRRFHDKLYQETADKLHSPAHLLDKMREFWFYFSDNFADPHKAFKAIKKSRTREQYEARVSAVFENLIA